MASSRQIEPDIPDKVQVDNQKPPKKFFWAFGCDLVTGCSKAESELGTSKLYELVVKRKMGQ